MICRLCLKDIVDTEIIKIFGEIGVELNVAEVLEKFFWFSPKNDDPISTAVCNPCWRQVTDFHEFYISIEDAHRLLAERFSVKKEDVRLLKQKHHPISNTNVGNAQVTKSEIDIEEEEFNLLLEETAGNESSLKSVANESENEEKYWDEQPFDDDGFMNDKNVQETPDDGDNKDQLAILKEEEQNNLTIRNTQAKRRSKRSHAKENSYSSEDRQKSKKKAVKPLNHDRCETANEKIGTRRLRARPSSAINVKNKSSRVKAIKKSKSDAENSADTDTTDDANASPKIDEADTKISQHMRLVCYNCNLEQPNFFLLKKHISAAHNCKGYVICCNRKFFKRTLLLGHIERHLNPDYYKCDQCDKVLADRQCLRNHVLLKHQPDEVKTFQCKHCPKKYAKSYLLEHHRITHEARTHLCNICEKGFPSVHLLKSHIKVIHQNYGTMCDICAKVIRGRAAFTKHQLEHAGITQPRVQCDKCGSWHKNKYSLQKHKRRHNEEGTLHMCNICGKVAPNRSALLSHQRYVHDTDRPYECSVCKKAFKKPVGLREHMAMHTGEVLYKCPHCTKTFNSNANMHSHRKKVHPKEFEETRKQRAENASKENQVSTASTALLKRCSTNAGIPQLIRIQTTDDGETHNILVTTEDINNEQEMSNDGNSIIFTVN